MKWAPAVLLGLGVLLWAQTGPPPPGVFFREDWNTKEPFEEVDQSHVANADLVQSLWGPGGKSVKKRHHGTDADPYYIWSGAAPANWALTLRHKTAYADLRGRSKIRWRTMESGFRRLHVVLKLANGAWLVSEEATGESKDWTESEHLIVDLHWRKLDIENILEGPRVDNPDLSRVDEIGFTDLMRGGPSPAGSSSAASSRIDWIEVHAFAVKRETAGWVKHVIASGFSNQTVVPADFDGDGRMDVITGDITPKGERVILYRGPDWKPQVLHEGIRTIYGVALDVNGDGRLDVVASRYHPGLVYWLEQPRKPTDKWTYHGIDDAAAGGADGVHGLVAGDVDRDGKLDIVASSGEPEGALRDSLVWYRVPRDPANAARWDRFVIADRDATGLSHYLGFGDVNGDGRPDVASAAKDSPGGNWFAWWEQGADPRRPWTKHLIAANQKDATNIVIHDMNGDGKPDFVASRGHGAGIVWYEAPNWTSHDIAPGLKGPHSLAVDDLNGDGFPDVITVAKDARVAAWYENDGNGRFVEHRFDDNQSAYDIRLVDMDGDGDLDLLVAGFESRNVVWYENQLRQTPKR
jgi:hypothetical protein